MTDDERAAAALEILAGVRRCAECQQSMQRTKLTEQNVSRARVFVGWYCEQCNVYVLDDGTEMDPGPGGNTFLRERDYYWDEQVQAWVPDEIG